MANLFGSQTEVMNRDYMRVVLLYEVHATKRTVVRFCQMNSFDSEFKIVDLPLNMQIVEILLCIPLF